VHAARAAIREEAGCSCSSQVWLGLSKLNSVRKSDVEVDVLLGESDSPTASRGHRRAIKGSDAYRNEIPVSLERR
jgi:hypothetical protein